VSYEYDAAIQIHVNWAREFRYDGARQRYMNRTLDAGAFKSGNVFDDPPNPPVTRTATMYDGDQPYADFQGFGSPPTTLRAYALGTATVDPFVLTGDANTMYYHTDQLGTTRRIGAFGTSSCL